MHRARRRTLGAALLMLAALLAAAPAQAHDYLVGSTPEQGAALDTAPSKVALEFNTSIGQRFAQVAVVGPDGTAFSSGDPVVEGAVVTQAVEGIPAGTDVTISYRVVSSDGHPIGGTVGFAVAAAAPAEAGPAPSSDASATTEDDVDPAAATDTADTSDAGPLLPWLALPLIGAATIAALATFAVTRRRRRAMTGDGTGAAPSHEAG